MLPYSRCVDRSRNFYPKMALSSLLSVVAAFSGLSMTAVASPVPKINNATLSQPIGVPDGGFTSQFYGPTPNIITLSTDGSIKAAGLTDVPPYVPEDAEVVDESEIHKRFIHGGSDDRVLWTNKSYPFSTMGKIQWSNGVFCSGSLIGPRHVATAKHCAPLNNEGVSVRFMPAYYDGETAQGAYVTTILHLPGYSVNNPRANSCDIKEDWAIFILDSRLGDQQGYLGGKIIDSSKIDKADFLHLGYPGDLARGERPYRQDHITVRNKFDCDSTGGLSTDADVQGGMSGGPIVSRPYTVSQSPLIAVLHWKEANHS